MPGKKKRFDLMEMKHKKFIELAIEATTLNECVAAYRKVYPQCKTWDTGRNGYYRLIINFPEVDQAIKEGRRIKEEQIREAVKQERIRLAKEKVAHEFELDAEMSDIALRRKKRQKKVVVVMNKTDAAGQPLKGKVAQIVTVEEDPTETDQIAAADKLYKRFGSYAPIGIQHEAGDSFLDFIKHAQNTNNNSIPNHVHPGSDK
jgi:hypothetical protein